MLTFRERSIIDRAARAQHAFMRLLSSATEDPRHKYELMTYRIAADAELRGDRRPRTPAYDLSTPIEDAVKLELEAMAPAVRTRIELQRQAKRLVTNCGPATLSLSYTAGARQKLRAIATTSALSQRELAGALGVSETTLFRHLRGERMSGERRDWYHRLERIVREDSFIHVVVRALSSTRATKKLIAESR